MIEQSSTFIYQLCTYAPWDNHTLRKETKCLCDIPLWQEIKAIMAHLVDVK
jgi:hypothetical protein